MSSVTASARSAPGPGSTPQLRVRVLSFSVIGVVCTVAFTLLYGTFRSVISPLEANFVALSVTISLNFLANRWLTFRAQGSLPRQALQYLAVYGVGLGASTIVLRLALGAADRPGRLLETLIALAASGVATVIRFLLLSAWVFRPGPTAKAAAAAGSGVS